MLKFSAHPISVNHIIDLQAAINLVEQWDGSLLYTSPDVDGEHNIILAFNPLHDIDDSEPLETIDHLLQNHQFTFPWIFGYLGYDTKGLLEEGGIYHNLRDTGFSLYRFHVYQYVIILDQQWSVKDAFELQSNAEKQNMLNIEQAFNISQNDPEHFSVFHLHSVPDQKGFMKGVRRIQEYIRAGDIYQVNLTRKISGRFQGNEQAAALALLKSNRIEFGVFYKSKDQYLISTSPERFFKIQKDKITASPIKGTAPRLNGDNEGGQKLIHDQKNLRELAMITDLLRNDISKICSPGSVKVNGFPILKTLKNVYHLVADVEGTLDDKLFSHIIKALFPGGSITGCPKVRACQIIEELEQKGRGPYTGSFGYLSGNGEMDFNILIRTVFIELNQLSFNVGGGITLLSDPEDEYEETLHKAQNILKALKQ